MRADRHPPVPAPASPRCRQIEANAVAYSSPGHGRDPNALAITNGQRLVALVRQRLRDNASELNRAYAALNVSASKRWRCAAHVTPFGCHVCGRVRAPARPWALRACVGGLHRFAALALHAVVRARARACAHACTPSTAPARQSSCRRQCALKSLAGAAQGGAGGRGATRRCMHACMHTRHAFSFFLLSVGPRASCCQCCMHARTHACAQAIDHWVGCVACNKWRRCRSYSEFISLNTMARFACKAMAGSHRTCAMTCDYCSLEPCTC